MLSLFAEIFPLVQSQLKIEGYNNADLSKSTQLKESLLKKIRTAKSSKGFNTASSENDFLLKSKLEKAEGSIKYMELNEKSLVARINTLQMHEEVQSKILSTLVLKIVDMQNQKIDHFSKDGISAEEVNKKAAFVPSIVKALQYDSVLDEDNGEVESVIHKSPHTLFQSICSTDENYLGEVDSRPNINIIDLPTQMWRKMLNKKLSKSAIGPKNLQMKKWDQSRYLGESMHKKTARTRVISSKYSPSANSWEVL